MLGKEISAITAMFNLKDGETMLYMKNGASFHIKRVDDKEKLRGLEFNQVLFVDDISEEEYEGLTNE